MKLQIITGFVVGLTSLAVVMPAATLAHQAAPTQIDLSLENRTLLRCSAAFAMVSHGQGIGNADALKWPKLDERGKEFFVRALANLMDQTGKSREEISQMVSAEAQRLWDSGTVNDVMPGCLLMLETSDL